MSYVATTKAEIDAYVSTLRSTFLSNKTKPLEYRRTQLKKFWEAMDAHEVEFQQALAKDFGKPPEEVILTETNTLKAEAIEVMQALPKWIKDEKGHANFPFNLAGPKIQKTPLGASLIIGAWNYPLFVTFGPLIGAIAAGCPCVIKPSELAPETAAVMQRAIHKHLDPTAYRVVLGAVEETTHLLAQKWGTIFYTGGGNVGRIVATAAAKHLTPVTLELGGKNAVILTKNSDLNLAAKRIAWGKVTNAGQTCVAPDFILFVDTGLEEKFIAAWKKSVAEFYPGEAWRKPGKYTRIVNENHYKRITKLLKDTRGRVVSGGFTDASQRLIEPTLVAGCTPEDSLMSEEIFGPVLPMLNMSSLNEAISFLQGRDASLALYIFTSDKSESEKLLSSVTSGGAMINDVLSHCALTSMPFGGVGESGTGAHNGIYGFNAFTHQRTVVNQPAWLELLFGVRYAPYTPSKMKQLAALAPKKFWNADYSERSRLVKILRFTLTLGALIGAYRYVKIQARL
ncbi:putative aldehyde dehydrogenase [Protomyces lactucae-debilis]|uniref:Aldehyde dehydrogenase n=1 Tax=Protomyces lactucae-debilis TaxID=2754530 RepID=A0A1Y2FKE4_PROLT|nr:putative aldehyde dehydrogenase [Protomyces lactucae-debilis]ORY83834.1 putative aldehyde dehydrogenase [Protomyces lactucae-debilis]